MFSNFAALPGVGSVVAAAASLVNFSPLTNMVSSAQEARLPGDWNTASSLGVVLDSATPERRSELIAALRSPEAQNVNQVLINDPDFANIVGVYNRAESAKTSMQQAYWGGNSTYGGIQDDIIAQE